MLPGGLHGWPLDSVDGASWDERGRTARPPTSRSRRRSRSSAPEANARRSSARLELGASGVFAPGTPVAAEAVADRSEGADGRCRRARPYGSRTPVSPPASTSRRPPWRRHASPKTTKLYDRTADTVTVDEIKRLPQSLDLQRDALRAAGVDDAVNLYHDLASGVRDDRPGLDSCPRPNPPPQLDVEDVELDVTDALEAGRRRLQVQAWRPPTTAAEPRRTSATRGTACLYQTGAGSTHCATSRTAAHPAPTTRPPYTA